MIGERYRIEVSDSEVLIHGYLSIREAFDFISFFDQQGYDALVPGDENSVLRLIKKKSKQQTDEEKQEEEDDKLEEIAYLRDVCREQEKKHKQEIQSLNKKLSELKSLVKKLIKDDHIYVNSIEIAKNVMNDVTKDDENELPY